LIVQRQRSLNSPNTPVSRQNSFTNSDGGFSEPQSPSTQQQFTNSNNNNTNNNNNNNSNIFNQQQMRLQRQQSVPQATQHLPG
jgi:hypothetical protein